MSKLVGGKKGKTASQQPQSSTPQLITSFTVTVDPSTGAMTVAKDGSSSARPGVQAQATQYTRAYELDLSGRATYSQSTAVLSGDVTLASASPTNFRNVKMVVTAISNSSVTVKNATGVTDLTGANNPFWEFGDLPGGSSAVRNWQFNVPTGTTFTFTLALFADVWGVPPGDGGNINGLWFLSGTPAIGWAVGQGGKILHTSDGGQNWSPQNSNVTVDLNDICFINSQQGWAVGSQGTILTTTNGGKTWRRQYTGIDYPLNAVAFADPSRGYAVGLNGLVLVTDNGGQGWSATFHADGDELYDVDAVGNQAWIVGKAAWILHTSDHGASWQQQQVSMTDLPFQGGQIGFNEFLCVDFVDANRGWLAGVSGILFRTTNGGATWVRQFVSSDPNQRPNITDIKFISSTHGWVTAIDQSTNVFRTTNGGTSWTGVAMPTFASLMAVTAVDAKRVWVAGNTGVILLTQNGDATGGGFWHAFVSGAADQLNDVHFPSRNTGYAVGRRGTIMKSSDGGKSWQQMSGTPFVDLNGIHFLSDTTGWIVGNSGTIFVTYDGGESWEQQHSGTSRHLNAIYMLDQDNGWVVGQNGTILVTSDGGSSWSTRFPSVGPISQALLDVRFLPDGSRGFIVGAGGAVLTSFDGTNWEPMFAYTTQPVNGIGIAPSGEVWIVGTGNVLRKLSADGFNWEEQFSGLPLTPELRAIHFIDANRGFLVGASGALCSTTNGGINWEPMDAGTKQMLRSVHFFDESLGGVVGNSGTIRTFR